MSAIFSFIGMRVPDRPAIFYVLKITALVFACSLFVHPSSLAFQLTLEWDPNVEQDLAGYILYYGTASRNYSYDVDIGDETSCTISGLRDGVRYYFAVTAYDDEGNESSYSSEVCFPDCSQNTSSSGGGSGGCFISSTADGQWTGSRSLTLPGAILAGIFGSLLCLRKRYTQS